jgi:HK97 gp10 family phage protein
MARPVVVDISPLVAWNKLLATESVAIAARVAPAVTAEAGAVQARVTAAVPVGITGALRSSIRTTGRGLRRRVAAGSAKAYYGPFQEFGTAKMPAHPFLITQANSETLTEFERRVSTATFAGAIYRGET